MHQWVVLVAEGNLVTAKCEVNGGVLYRVVNTSTGHIALTFQAQ